MKSYLLGFLLTSVFICYTMVVWHSGRASAFNETLKMLKGEE